MVANECLKFSVAVKRHHDDSNSYKGKHLFEVGYIFRGLVHYRHGGTWWHADRMVLGK